MKNISTSILAVFLLGLLPACGGNPSTSTPTSGAGKTIAAATATLSAVPSMTATLSAVPSATNMPTPSDTPMPTETTTPTSGSPEPTLNRSDIQSVFKWISYSILENKPEMLSRVIGNHGVVFGIKYQVDFNFVGYNNSDVIIADVKKGLQNAAPKCMGYDPNFYSGPEKTTLFFSGIKFDWDADISGFGLFNLEDGWELVDIDVPATASWPDLYQTLSACP